MANHEINDSPTIFAKQARSELIEEQAFASLVVFNNCSEIWMAQRTDVQQAM